MSLSQYQSIVQGFASGNSQRSESAGERFSSAKEGYLQRAGITRDLEERKEQNRYSSAIQGVESTYDATLKLYGDKVKKYQSEVLQQLGISEADQAKAQAVIGVAGQLGGPAGQLGGYLLKRINKSKGAKVEAKPKPKAKPQAKEEPQAEAETEVERDPVEFAEPQEIEMKVIQDKTIRPKVTYAEDSRGGSSSANFNEEVGTSELQDRPAVTSSDRPGSRLTSKLRGTKQAIQDTETESSRGKFSQVQELLAKKEVAEKQDANIQEVEDENLKELKDFQAKGGEVTTDDLEKAGLTGEDVGEAGVSAEGDVAKIAGQGALEAEEAAEALTTSLLADAGDIAVGAASIASDALGPLGVAVGLGLSVYEIGNAFHWWGGSDDSGDKPTPPSASAPTPPNLKDIPKPKDILVKAVAPTQSISAHYGLLAAPSTNSNIMRR